MTDHPDETAPWWQTTLMRQHPDRPPWWDSTLMTDHPDETAPWWQTTLMRQHPDDRPPWWDSTLMTDHPDETAPQWQTTLIIACVCACVCTCTGLSQSVCVHECVHVHVCVCVPVHTCLKSVCACAHLHVCVCTCLYCKYVCLRMSVHMYMPKLWVCVHAYCYSARSAAPDLPVFPVRGFPFTRPWPSGTGQLLVAADDGPHRVLRGQTRYEIKRICCGQHRRGDTCGGGRRASSERARGWMEEEEEERSTGMKSPHRTVHASSQTTVYMYCSKRSPWLTLLWYHTHGEQPPSFTVSHWATLLARCPCTSTACQWDEASNAENEHITLVFPVKKWCVFLRVLYSALYSPS